MKSGAQTSEHQSHELLEYNHTKLQQLIYDQSKFMSTILKSLENALIKARRGEFESALIHLANSEKVLEYGANCGKIIDRKLIITVLHNEAFCYQRIGERLKALKYIEAINYNLRSHITSLQSASSQTNIDPVLMQTLKNIVSPVTLLMKKLDLAKYQLQFCSLSSQLGHRSDALNSVKQAIKLYKEYFSGILVRNRQIQQKSQNEGQKQSIEETLTSIKHFSLSVQEDQQEEYLRIANFVIMKWQKKINKSNHFQFLAQYSIGKLVDLSEMAYQSSSDDQHETQDINNVYQIETIMKQICHFAMAHFQTGTQYRLVHEEQLKKFGSSVKQSHYSKMGMIYHLLSMIVIGLFVPSDVLFMRQIIGSFQFHYKKNLKRSDDFNEEPDMSLLYESNFIEQKKRQLTEKRLKKKQNMHTVQKPKQETKKGHKNKSRVKSIDANIFKERKSGQADTIKLRQEYEQGVQRRKTDKKVKHKKKILKNVSKSIKNHYFEEIGISKMKLTSNSNPHTLRSRRIVTSSSNSKFKHNQQYFTYGTTQNNSKMTFKQTSRSRSNSSDSHHQITSSRFQAKQKLSKIKKIEIKEKRSSHSKKPLEKSESNKILRIQGEDKKRKVHAPSKAKNSAINNYYL